MALKSVATTLPDGNTLFYANGILGIPGISVNRLIEAGLRAYNGETAEQIRDRIKKDAQALKSGGRKGAQVDEALIEGIGNKSRAIRVGLAMIAYEWTREDAEQWADEKVRWGRAAKKTQTI